MPFAIQRQISYFDCDFAGRLRLSAAMRLLQENSSQHLRALGFPGEKLFEEGMVFLLVKSCIQVHRMPRQDEKIQLLTAPVATKGVRFVREYAVDSPEGERLLSVSTLWVLADTREHRPMRPKSFPYPLELHPSFLAGAMGDEPLMGEPLGETVGAYSQRVGYSHLDNNRHVNNSIYADFALDALPLETVEQRELEQVIISFRHEAVQGQEIGITARRLEGGHSFYVAGEVSGQPCFEANLRFR